MGSTLYHVVVWEAVASAVEVRLVNDTRVVIGWRGLVVEDPERVSPYLAEVSFST